MTNSYSKYYSDQAGSGIDVYSGDNHNMNGAGFFGKFFTGRIQPLLSSFLPVVKDSMVHGAEKVVQHLSKKIKHSKRKRSTTKRKSNSAPKVKRSKTRKTPAKKVESYFK